MRYDVGIIGGGVIGLACAWRLAQAGARVALFERGQVGRLASWAAAGMLAAQCEAVHHPPDENPAAREAIFDLCLQSRALYPAFAAELHSETGVNVELSLNEKQSSDWRTPGILYLATRDDDPAPEAFARQKESGQRVEEAEWNGAKAMWLPDEGQVNNRSLVTALHRAGMHAGVTFHEGRVAVPRNIHEKGCWNRVTHVGCGSESFECGCVLICAGCCSDHAVRMPSSPVAGEMLVLRMTDEIKNTRVRHIVYGSDVYLVPRHNGNLLVGATMRNSGPHFGRVTAGGVLQLLSAACALAPQVSEYVFIDHWAGIRPASPDGLPILGQTPIENLFVATGHFRNGILLAPITGQIMADCILKGEKVRPEFELNRFAPCASL